MFSDPALRADGAMKEMYYQFAFTSNIRGWNAIKELASIKPLEDSRFIDVGCAYGGFVVAAMRHGAYQSVGIEINPRLASIAIDNARDNSLEEKVQIIVGDALDSKLLDSLGQFNFVVCNDVIEHVSDARLLARRISRLLAPSGVAYLEIPNKRAASFLLSDGHYSLFGITALPQYEAKKYYEHHFLAKTYEDSMGEYYELDEYISWFGQEGGQVVILKAYRPHDALEQTCRGYAKFLDQLKAPRPKNLPPEIWYAIRDHGMRFYRHFDSDHHSMVNGAIGGEEFLQRYHDTFWRLIVQR